MRGRKREVELQASQGNIAHKLLLENKFSKSNFVQFNTAAIAACSFGAL